jgi:hypothetical protein
MYPTAVTASACRPCCPSPRDERCSFRGRVAHLLSQMDALAVVASIDVNQVPAGSCIDSSMIERDKHEGELAERLPKEFIARYYDELKGRTVRRLATPKK